MPHTGSNLFLGETDGSTLFDLAEGLEGVADLLGDRLPRVGLLRDGEDVVAVAIVRRGGRRGREEKLGELEEELAERPDGHV